MNRKSNVWLSFMSGLGVLMITVTVSLFLGNQFARYQSRKIQLRMMEDFERHLENMQQTNHMYYGSGSSEYMAVTGDTIAILRLDRLKIKVNIAEGIEKDILKLSAGHFTESSMPGQGNFSIAGHSSREYVCLFNDMDQAVIGDEVIVTTRQKRHRYLVSEIIIAEPDEVKYLNPANESILTIVTCTNSGKQRLIIRAVEV